MKHLKTLIVIGTMSLTLAVATAAAEISPQERAAIRERMTRVQIGAECVLDKGAIVGRTQDDLRLGERLTAANDMVALQKMLEAGGAFMTGRVVTGYVERQDERYVEMRPKGELLTVWTYRLQLDCHPISTETPVAKKIRRR